ncbi:hypothetical protein BN1048_00408 [Jeotgalicoccus saudimassiliensis]|uniref:DUF4064 domain-containing protein n=1 Tax=Jeotgalicoccus saudimassiliensis TaxID=1461582 RepID=A0A078LZD6_9STAP|nr:DUF4064 domain-containing protein [Jeotgalicoccus saudimassiliensis]CDZ99325.1 hypothetical protein BN1048_00408 [Jeotgalicoccus saudimassiliensis]
MAKEYTQTVKPVSRIAERIFGWLGWLLLLAFTAGILFFSLVTMNDQATIDNVTTQLEAELQTMELQGADPQAVIDMTLGFLGNFWMISLYLVLPLIISLIGLLNMRRRILAGILLLLAAILAAPLVVTLISSLFFVIAAILLFARKDLVVKNEHPEDAYPRDDRGRGNDYNARDDYRHEQSHRHEERRTAVPADDDVKLHEKRDSEYGYDDKSSHDDIESTRKFSRIDEDEVNAVDDNIDSRNINRPVTENEYNRNSGVDFDEADREDPARTRRDNVDRRNRN